MHVIFKITCVFSRHLEKFPYFSPAAVFLGIANPPPPPPPPPTCNPLPIQRNPVAVIKHATKRDSPRKTNAQSKHSGRKLRELNFFGFCEVPSKSSSKSHKWERYLKEKTVSSTYT